MLPLINMPILQYASKMRTPTLIVHGEKAYLQDIFQKMPINLGNTNKELYIVLNATHVDLLTMLQEKIPYDKFEKFFKDNLK